MTNHVFVINAKKTDNQLIRSKLGGGNQQQEDKEYMKNAFQNIINKMRPSNRANGRRKESIIAACQLVRGSALGIQRALSTFKTSLTEKGNMSAVNVISELEGLAQAAYSKITDRLVRLTGASTAVEYVDSPLHVKDGSDASWTPATWIGIHAELLTYFVRSVEVCRRALTSRGIMFDAVTRHALVEILALFEEMLWIARSNDPKFTDEVGDPLSADANKSTSKEVKSCALMTSSSTVALEVVPGTLELSRNAEKPAIFVPRGDPRGKQVLLTNKIVERLIDLHPERQPLFQGCTHIVEVTTMEMNSLDAKLEDYIVRPLIDSDAGNVVNIGIK